MTATTRPSASRTVASADPSTTASIVRLFRLDHQRWVHTGRDAVWSATAVVTVGAFLLSLARFGGLSATEPRAFLRLALVAVWGWIGVSAVLWAIGRTIVRITEQPDPCDRDVSLRRSLAVVGLAHVPVLYFAGVVFVAAMLFRWLGPGTVAAWVVFAAWLPATLVAGVRAIFGLGFPGAIAVTALAYAGWYGVVGRHLLEQVGHLL